MRKIFRQGELSCRPRVLWLLRRQTLFEFLFAERKRTALAVRHPIAEAIDIRHGINAVQSLITIIDVGNFIWADHAALLIDPHCGWHVYHVVKPRHQMLSVNQRGEVRLGRRNPGRCVFHATRVLRDRNDLEVFVFQLTVKFLPSRQIEPAPSPRGPRDKQDFLATKIRE